jgi:hypothetical protein
MELGGIPSIISPRDMCSGAPDEKVVITYVAYLSSRLLDIRLQTVAAEQLRKLQKKWKTGKHEHLSSPVQPISSGPVHEESAAIFIQKVWRGIHVRHELVPMLRAQLVSVELLQATFRARIQRKRYLQEMIQICRIQALVRARAAKSTFARTLETLQINAVTTVQSLFRGFTARKALRAQKEAETKAELVRIEEAEQAAEVIALQLGETK